MKNILLSTTGFGLLHSTNSFIFPNLLGGGGGLLGGGLGWHGGKKGILGCHHKDSHLGGIINKGFNHHGVQQAWGQNFPGKKQSNVNDFIKQQTKPKFDLPPVGSLIQEGNFIQNGNFNFPQLGVYNQFINSLPGWQSNEIERGIGSIYNSRWGNIVVVELDGNQNNFLRQRISLEKGRYTLSFKWAGRSSKVHSSAMQVYWNNIKIFEVTAKNDQINIENIPIIVTQNGTNVLQFKGTGQSDSLGMTISNVRLTRDYSQPEPKPAPKPLPQENTRPKPVEKPTPKPPLSEPMDIFIDVEEQINQNTPIFTRISSENINSVVNQRIIQTPFWQIKGFTITTPQRFNPLIKQAYNILVSTKTQVSQIRQRIRLEEGTFLFKFSYIAKKGVSNPKKFEVTINDKIIGSPQPVSDLKKVFSAKFTVSKSGLFILGINVPISTQAIAIINPRIQFFQQTKNDLIKTSTTVSKKSTLNKKSENTSNKNKTTKQIIIEKNTPTKPIQQFDEEQDSNKQITSEQKLDDLTSQSSIQRESSQSKIRKQVNVSKTNEKVKINDKNKKDIETGAGLSNDEQQEPQYIFEEDNN